MRVRLEKPRLAVVFHGCCVFGFGGRVGVEEAASIGAGAAAAVFARAAAALASSFGRQQCLYFRPDPQRHLSLRPGRAIVEALIERSVPYWPLAAGAGHDACDSPASRPEPLVPSL